MLGWSLHQAEEYRTKGKWAQGTCLDSASVSCFPSHFPCHDNEAEAERTQSCQLAQATWSWWIQRTPSIVASESWAKLSWGEAPINPCLPSTSASMLKVSQSIVVYQVLDLSEFSAVQSRVVGTTPPFRWCQSWYEIQKRVSHLKEHFM